MSTQFKLVCDNRHVAEFVYGGDCGILDVGGQVIVREPAYSGRTPPILGRIRENSSLVHCNARNRNSIERILCRL
jgi:hypothetical protein